MNLKDYADIGAKVSSLPSRFICAWWYAENGEAWPLSNNPGNVSYLGQGTPSSGVFKGATRVEANKVVVYDNAEDGIEAWYELLKAPTQAHGGTKYLTVDLEDIEQALKVSIEEAAKVIGESNWAESHYNDGKGPGSLIVDAYDNSIVSEWYNTTNRIVVDNPQPVDKSGRVIHIVQSGETLWKIGLDYRVPYTVIASFNGIKNADSISIGERIAIPNKYRVSPGDTLSGIVEQHGYPGETWEEVGTWNRIDPNRIFVGQTIFL